MEPAAGQRQAYAPIGARVGVVVLVTAAAWWALDLALAGQRAALARDLPWLVLASVLAYLVFWRPEVAVDEDGVTLRNPLRDVRIPWPALEAVDTRFALTLITHSGKHRSWAAAAPGRPSMLGMGSRRSGEAAPGEAFGRASTGLQADSGAAAFLVQQRWGAWQGRHRAHRPESEPAAGATVSWNVIPLAVAAASVALGVVASSLG